MRASVLKSSLVVVVGLEARELDQAVALGAGVVALDHLADHLGKTDRRLPPESRLGLRRVAEQGLDFGGTEIAWVDAHDHVAGLAARTQLAACLRDRGDDAGLVDAGAAEFEPD